jgi:mutual gliding-motility protein MglA
MVLVSYSGREINAKLVYYGPGLSGKTTNLEYIYGSIPQTQRGKMVSMKTKTERTLFFDFLPVDLGELSGFKTRFLLYTVPGQVYYNATRKLVLKGVDAVVFVADSKRGKMDENVESLANLRENLRENGLDLDQVPWVMQYNKRDLPDVYTVAELEQVLNLGHVPAFEAVATTGQGVVGTFKAVSRLLLRKLAKEIGVQVVTAPHETASVPEESLTPVPSSRPEPAAPEPVEAFTPAAPAPTPASIPAAPPEPVEALVREEVPVQAFEAPQTEPEAAAAYAPEAPEGAGKGLSVGERLRRWLSGPGEAQQAPESEETASEPATAMAAAPAAPAEPAPPVEATAPPAAAAAPVQPPAPPEVPRVETHTSVLSLPPRRAVSGSSKPREIIVPLSLEARDLETGVVLRIAFQMPAQGTDEGDNGLEEAA